MKISLPFTISRITLFLYVAALLPMLVTSCKYSFRGINIPLSANNFYIEQFDLLADNAPATLDVIFTERLRDKIRSESRLTYNDTDPDIEFRGAITIYDVSSVAPQPGETTAFSRLDISVSVEYINHKDETLGWTRSFKHFSDFANDQNLLSIQDQLIRDINEQLVEDIFNAAFSNW